MGKEVKNDIILVRNLKREKMGLINFYKNFRLCDGVGVAFIAK